MSAMPSHTAISPPKPSLWPGRLATLGASCLLFIIACCLPCLYTLDSNMKHDAMFGIGILLTGWSGVFVGIFAWFANPLLFLAWLLILCRLWRTAALMTLLAMLLASQTFTIFFRTLPADEGDVNHYTIQSFGIGFYFWVASLLIALVGSLLLWRLSAKKN
jgi:hypothetical protein